MISIALKYLAEEPAHSTQRLAEAREQISKQFASDYVVGSHAMEKLISAQLNVQYWSQVERVLAKSEKEEDKVAGLREWARTTAERILEGGRSRSTSLVATAMIDSEEEEQKAVLARVRQFLNHIDK